MMALPNFTYIVFFIFIFAMFLMLYYSVTFFFDKESEHLSGNQSEEQKERYRFWVLLVIMVFGLIVPMEIILVGSERLRWYETFGLLFVYIYICLFFYIAYTTQKMKANILLYEQLSHGLDIFIENFRLGYSLNICFKQAAKKIEKPLGKFFQAAHFKIDSGVSLDESLLQSATRVRQLAYIQHFIVLLTIHEKTGVPLVDELMHLKLVLIKHKQDMQRLNVAVALSKYSALITSFLPVVMVITLYWVEPSFLMPFLNHPISIIIVIFCACLILLGLFLIFRRTQIKFFRLNGEPS